MRTKVKLGLKGLSVPELLGFSVHAVTEMTSNGFFPAPSPALSQINNAISALVTAFDQAIDGGPPQTAVMRQKRELLEGLLTDLGHYVEGIANDPVNASSGADAIILSAGMNTKQKSPRQKRTFGAKAGEMPGTAELTAEHISRGMHEWQYTSDISNPSGWISVEPTLKAAVTISGLESGKLYFFRHRSILKDGPTDYDGPADCRVS